MEIYTVHRPIEMKKNSGRKGEVCLLKMLVNLVRKIVHLKWLKSPEILNNIEMGNADSQHK